STTQPTDAAFQEEIQGWQNLFRKNEDNRNKGVRNYNLTTTVNFKAYAVWYSGLYQKYSRNAFEFGMRINGQLYKLFGNRHLPLDTQEPDAVNPGFAADIEIERGITFDFYMKYTETVKNSEGKLVSVTNTLYSKDGNSILLYSDETQEKMIIGFEDKIQDNWTPNGNKDIPDFSDVIVYIEGNPLLPVLEAKRFLCEDMSGDQADFDFNDIVFDVQPIGGKRAKVTLWAGGGVYNAKIKIGGTWLSNAQGETEIHKLLGIRPPQYLANTDNRTTMPFVTTMEVENVQALNDFKDVEIYVQTQNGQPWICSGFPGDGDIPLMIAVPTSVRWMIEKYRITRGYPDFYYGEWYNADNIHPEFMFDTSKYMAAGLQQ
ncbi:MAG: hypothetical protein HUK03_09825, partial [Bacteroidaceae bacterium]|nr:hypothetical protein [Bacteroidaceae bacterium]